ncbi:hypothetical protein ADIARSV_0929 [Arcticibacter svalbardensis MN12-7]|uniref:Uncharacterized protein n=1 Tax=Arcticibacter svalbardensis MN12-7 TaxID=1150600 RepID=R9GVJ0_9SPHI|nr:hypothetical protein [Arcticibacter svalbardensis]EOR95867.1 hypothetical protein ADIARSV_0929 [Arcticibacter svalbardensis MN12-7]
MDIEERLNSLKNIQEVDVPPFLFTRIQQGIKDKKKKSVPMPWRWAFAASGLLILALNLSVFYNQVITKERTNISTLASAMQMTNSNDLYNEQN